MKKEATGFRLIFGYLGIFMVFIGLITALPLVMLIFYPEEKACIPDFLCPLVIYVVIGLILYFTLIFKRKKKPFARCEDRHLLMLIWIFAIVAGALPFLHANMTHGMDMNFSESIFEATSAYSTTGLTCFKDYIDVEGAFAPHVFVYHRAQMQFVGGAGLVLVLACILSSSGSMSLFSSEGHNDRIMPNMGHTAKIIFGIMAGYAVVGTLALWFAGMPLFDAWIISLCSISGGGMAPTSQSIAFYRTVQSNGIFSTSFLAIEIIVSLLSMFSAVSYVLHVMLLKGKVLKFFRDAEVKFALFMIAFCALFSGVGACYAYSKANSVAFGTNWTELFGDSLFYVITSAATTGFSSLDTSSFLTLGKPIIFACVLLMLIGGGMGSAGGGIKQYRIILCLKDLLRNIKYRFSSDRTLNPTTIYRYGERRQIEKGKFKEAHNYAVLYLIVFISFSALLCVLPDINPEKALFDVSSGMSNTGLALIDYVSYGKLHPHAYPVLLWVLSLGMLLGRLEIMPFIDAIRNYSLEFKAINSEKRKKKAENQNL